MHDKADEVRSVSSPFPLRQIRVFFYSRFQFSLGHLVVLDFLPIYFLCPAGDVTARHRP